MSASSSQLAKSALWKYVISVAQSNIIEMTIDPVCLSIDLVLPVFMEDFAFLLFWLLQIYLPKCHFEPFVWNIFLTVQVANSKDKLFVLFFHQLFQFFSVYLFLFVQNNIIVAFGLCQVLFDQRFEIVFIIFLSRKWTIVVRKKHFWVNHVRSQIEDAVSSFYWKVSY